MAEGTTGDTRKLYDSRGDAEDGYNSARDTSGTGGERDRLVKQDGGDSARYTDDVIADAEMAVEEHNDLDQQQWQAPDGGWAYVIMISAFFMSFIVDGITYTFGIFLGDLEEAFQAPKSQITLAGSIQVGAYHMMGPIASAFTNAYGCRAVMIGGTLITATAYIVTLWTNHIYVLIVVYGLIGGIGYGLMYLPSIVAVSMYFDRKRTLATCIALCGSGVGMLVFAPVTEYLLNEFSWRWTIFIQGVVILNGLVLAGLIRPLYFGDPEEGEKEEKKEEKKKIGDKNRTSKMGTDNSADDEFEIIEIREIARTKTVPGEGDLEHSGREEKCTKKEVERRASGDFNQRRRRSSLSARRSSHDDGHWLVAGRRPRRLSESGQGSKLPRWRDIWEAIPGITLTNHDEKWTVVIQEIQRQKEEAEVEERKRIRQRSKSAHVVKFPRTPIIPENTVENSTVSPSIQEPPEERFIQSEPSPRSRAYTIAGTHKMHSRRGSRWGIPLSPGSTHSYSRAPIGLSFISLSDVQLSQSLDDPRAQFALRSLNQDLQEPEQKVTCGGCWAKMGESFGEAMAEMLNCSILMNKPFWFVLLGNLFVLLGFYVPFVYISERAVELGIDASQAAFLISIIGATNVVSRAVTGIFMQVWKVDAVLATGLSLVVASVSVAACPLLDSYTMLAFSAGVFGFSTAVFVSLCSILLCEILGINNLANAFGFVILFRGVASSLGSPLAGAIIDATGRYDEAFYLAGLMILLGGLSHLLLYVIYLSPCRKCFKVRGQKVTYLEEPDTGSSGQGVRDRKDDLVERV